MLITPSHLSGEYQHPFIFSVSGTSNLHYKINDSPLQKYHSPILISTTCSLWLETQGEKLDLHFSLPQFEPNQGPVFIIGGADRCAEIHQAIIESAGGADHARVAFVPAGSANPYAAGMDRLVRFEKMARLVIDYSDVPKTNGKYDFSSPLNKSRFRILPVAIIDDPETCDNPKNDPEHVINDESTFPAINESTWNLGGFDATLAQSILDHPYSAFFLTGGNQTRYIKALLNPDGSDGPLLAVIRWLHHYKKAVIAGTSAGGAGLSKTMITGGTSAGAWLLGFSWESLHDEIASPEDFPKVQGLDDGLVVGPGLGFLSSEFVSDTHFFNRSRYGRLLKAMQVIEPDHGKPCIGIGVGENTAACLLNHSIKVFGEEAAFVAFKQKENEFITHIVPAGNALTWSTNEQGELCIKHAIQGVGFAAEDLPDTLFSTDIFRRYEWESFIFNNLTAKNCSMVAGTALSSSYNTYFRDGSSPDRYPLLRFSSTEESLFTTADTVIHQFGKRDSLFPEIQKERHQINGYSHVLVKLENLLIINNSGQSTSGRYTRPAIWLDANQKSITAHVFFMDYEESEDEFGEYRQLIDTEPASGANLMINNERIITDRNGMAEFCFSETVDQIHMRSKSGIEISLNSKVILNGPVLIIGDQSY